MHALRLLLVLMAAESGLTMPGPSRSAKDGLVRPIGIDAKDSGFAFDHFPFATARVLRVSSLASSGAGSLRAALRESGPRLVVFEVGGVIDLQGKSLEIKEGPVLVAGETAPPPGITLIRGSLVIEAPHVTVRHLAVRPGDRGPAGTSWQPDGITIDRAANPVFDVLIQNCSATWAVDENASASGPADPKPAQGEDATAHDVAFIDNLFAEALFRSTHVKGPHSMGLLVHDGIRRARIQGNVFASNNERNPRLKGGVTGAVVSNVLYNWGSAAIGVGRRGNREILDGTVAVVANNIAIAGPDTPAKARTLLRSVDPGGSAFLRGNRAFSENGGALAEVDAGVVPLPAAPADLGDVPGPDDAAKVLSTVLSRAGFRPAERDPIDRRIIASILSGEGRIIDSQEAVGGYPVRAATHRALDVPKGGPARRAWLEDLSTRLSTDQTLDVSPLLKRLGLAK